jgi:hypothetical protein
MALFCAYNIEWDNFSTAQSAGFETDISGKSITGFDLVTGYIKLKLHP